MWVTRCGTVTGWWVGSALRRRPLGRACEASLLDAHRKLHLQSAPRCERTQQRGRLTARRPHSAREEGKQERPAARSGGAARGAVVKPAACAQREGGGECGAGDREGGEDAGGVDGAAAVRGGGGGDDHLGVRTRAPARAPQQRQYTPTRGRVIGCTHSESVRHAVCCCDLGAACRERQLKPHSALWPHWAQPTQGTAEQ